MEGEVHFGRTPDLLKVPVPDKQGRELVALARTLEQSRQRRDELIVELLIMGCPQREIAAAAGLSHGAVQQIGKAAGYPPPELVEKRRKAREEAAAQRDRWKVEIDEVKKPRR